MKEKHIFIGLGGSGCTTVANLKFKIYEKCPETDRKRFLDDNYRFLFIDTDPADIDRANKAHRHDFEHGKVEFINPRTEMIDLGKGNPSAIYQEAKKDPENALNSRILESCSAELAALIPDQQLAFGAGAFRMKSRLSFARSLSDFQQKLEASINSLNNVKTSGGDTNRIFYWVVTSTNGGTGSGIVEDVLYYVNMQHKQSVSDCEPYLVLVQYMPKAYIDANPTNDKYALNAYAVMQEEEGLKKWSKDADKNRLFHRLAMVKDYNLINKNLPYNPFYFMIPIDYQTDKETTLGDMQTMYRNTSEMLYYVHSGEGGAQFRSDLDNYMNDILMNDPKAFLVPMGYIAVRKPEQDFREYMTMRFKYELVKHGLLNEGDAVADAKQAASDFEHVFYRLLDSSDKIDTLANEQRKLTMSFIDRFEYDEAQQELHSEETLEEVVAEYRNALKNIVGSQKVVLEDAHTGRKHEVDVGKYPSIDATEKDLWKVTEGYIVERGLKYAQAMVAEYRKLAKAQIKVWEEESKELKSNYAPNSDTIAELYEKAKEVTMLEKVARSNKKDVSSYYDTAKDSFENYVRALFLDELVEMMRVFCGDDTRDNLSTLNSTLQKYVQCVNKMNIPARDAFKDVSKEFNRRSMDVTSVFLPSLQDMIEGNEWKEDHFFAQLYGSMLTPSNKMERGVGKVPYRSEQAYDSRIKSIERFLRKSIYGMAHNPDSTAYKLAKQKQFLIGSKDGGEEMRFFCNLSKDNVTTRTPHTVVEGFMDICTEIFEEEMLHNQLIQENWLNKSIYQFFDELSVDDKEELRKRLDPSIFFSYKQNRLQDIPEGRIYVAETPIVAERMLGKTTEQGGHDKFAQTAESNAAFIIKFRYGMRFSDYRVYDTLMKTYEDASFKEKYHFHKLFSEYGEGLSMKNMPMTTDAAHRTFAILLLLHHFSEKKELKQMDGKPMFKLEDIFFSPEDFTWMQEYYRQSLLDLSLTTVNNAIYVASPESLEMKNNKISICSKDGDRDLFVELAGKNYAEYFDVFEREYHNRRFDETVNQYIKLLKDRPLGVDVAKIMRYNFEDVKRDLLQKINAEIMKHDECEQFYKTLFFSLMQLDVNLLK